MALRLSFYGGAGKVTGSNFGVSNGQSRVLIDCGIEQGADVRSEDIYGPFPYDPASMHALVVTHAHLDHVGKIPKLVRDGFKGKIYMTSPTRDLAALILLDSAAILAMDAKKFGRDPLFTDADVEETMALVETLPYHEEREVAPGITAYLRNTGHILGSASVRLTDTDGTAVAFTGDIGNTPSPLLPDWEPIPDVDALVMESVYGDRVHPREEDRIATLRDTLKRAIERGGAVLIPAFSIERTQLMLYELSNMFESGELPKVPVYLDSPLAIKVTEVYEKWGSTFFKTEAEAEMKREVSLFKFPFLKETPKRDDSAAIAREPNPKIIIAGAGMSHGGRIGEWEAKYLPDKNSTLIMVGYQAPGTPGRRIMEGGRSVHVGHQQVSVNAKVEDLEGWSGHADRDGLLSFAEAALKDKRPKAIFAAIGEPASERFLAQRIHDYLGGNAIVPEFGQTWEITKNSVTRA